MRNKLRGVTLIELVISITIISVMVLGLYSINIFSRNQVLSSDRRAKLQIDLVNALEHMSKYVHQANGNFNNPAIEVLGSGFRVRVDFNSPQTPLNLADDGWVSYALSGNTLSVSCAGSCGSFVPDPSLNVKIIAGFDNLIMPSNPDKGFYAWVSDQGSFIEIGLVGRYNPASGASLDNPQIEMKTKVICNGSSAN